MAKHIKQLGVPDDFEYIERERHATAIHEACHAVTAYRLRRNAVIDIATIERRGDVGGLVSYIPPEDQMFDWKSEREIDVMGSLASLAGERMFFDGDNSVGVGGDMHNATRTVVGMLGLTAMGNTIASHSVSLGTLRGAMPIEDGSRTLFDGKFGSQIEAKLEELYARVWDLLEENRAEVLAVAHVLETHRTVTGDDIAAAIEGTVGPTVDGRPYKDPSFRKMLENYHQAALRAHKEHSALDTMIPVPIPPPPTDVIPGSVPRLASMNEEEPPHIG